MEKSIYPDKKGDRAMSRTIVIIIVAAALLFAFLLVVMVLLDGRNRRRRREEHIREEGRDPYDDPVSPARTEAFPGSHADGFGGPVPKPGPSDSYDPFPAHTTGPDPFPDPFLPESGDFGFDWPEDASEGAGDPDDIPITSPSPDPFLPDPGDFGSDWLEDVPESAAGSHHDRPGHGPVCGHVVEPRPPRPSGSVSSKPSHSEETLPVMDEVRFSAVTDYSAERGNYQEIDIFMYTDAWRGVVDAFMKEGDRREKTSGYYRTSIGSRITVILECMELSFRDKMDSCWAGRYLDFNFAVWIPEDCARKQLRFKACIYIENVYSCALNLIVPVKAARTGLEVERKDIRSAFISYSSMDRNQVAAIVFGMKKVRPDMDIFFDVEKLRSGSRWEEILMQEIRSRDILYLCWSKNARNSEYVRKEWKCAYEDKGLEGIEPIPLEKPSLCPPPEELKDLHFGDLMVYIMEDAKEGQADLQCVSEGTILHLKKGLISVGAGFSNDFVVNDKDMEEKQFSISWNGNRGFLLQNLGKADPTVVIADGKKRVLAGPVSATITAPCIIKAGSTVFLLQQ